MTELLLILTLYSMPKGITEPKLNYPNRYEDRIVIWQQSDCDYAMRTLEAAKIIEICKI